MSGIYYEESMNERYQTPESFRTGRVVEEPLEREITPPSRYQARRPEVNSAQQSNGRDSALEDEDMSNPYIDPGFSHPYQISQNRYKEQVFGSSRPQVMEHNMKPEPLPLEQMQQRQGAYDQSPRRNAEYYDDRTYRSGRPDLGPAKESYVPYPQEPLNRPRNMDWMQPPSIGQSPHGTDGNPKPHPGWIILMRFHKDGEDQVQRALYMCQKHIESDGGRIMGLARPHGVKIREGGENWVTYGKLRHHGGGVWNPQESPLQEDTNFCVLAIYYPSLSRAKQWLDRDVSFKQKDFPKPYCSDCIALPLSSSVDTEFSKTLVLTMYPKISHAEYFREKFAAPTEEMMMKRFRSTPYVVKTTYVPVEDTRHRVAHHLRGHWLPRNSIITLSMFDSLQETYRFYTDPEFYECKKYQDRVSAPTTVVFDQEDWRPKSVYDR